tara:strand:- start:280 stop:486 length:207 start_codon:yes stop_codon:yes gene_type:complete
MSNKNKATSRAYKNARHLKQLEEEHQTRLNNSNAIFFTMQVKSRPEYKDIDFQEWCNGKVEPLKKRKK